MLLCLVLQTYIKIGAIPVHDVFHRSSSPSCIDAIQVRIRSELTARASSSRVD